MRGWLTEQHSTLFHSSLRYDGTTLGTAGLYSGNIAEWEWRRGPGSQANAWVLSYDGASRMTDARRYTGSLASSATMTASTSAEVEWRSMGVMRRKVWRDLVLLRSVDVFDRGHGAA